MTLARRDLQMRHCLSLTYTSVWSEQSVLSHISRATVFISFPTMSFRHAQDTKMTPPFLFADHTNRIPLTLRKNAMKIKFFNRVLKGLWPMWDTRHEHNQGLIMIAVGAAKIYVIDLISVWIRQTKFLVQEFVPLKNKNRKKKTRKGMSGIIIFKLINSRRFSMVCYLYINFACP